MSELCTSVVSGISESARSVYVCCDDYLLAIKPWKLILGTAVSVIIVQRARRLWRASEKPITTRLSAALFNYIRYIPLVRDKVNNELVQAKDKLLHEIHKCDTERIFVRELPSDGFHEDLIVDMAMRYESMSKLDVAKGKVSGAVYTDRDLLHTNLLLKVFSLYAFSNPLHPDVFPGCRKMEAEIVRMVAGMYHGDEGVCGTVTSGGTESIMLAMLSYRNFAHAKGISEPEILVPITAHAAFDKAAFLFGMRIIHVPVDDNYRVDILLMKKAISRSTCVLVGSAPNFPTGTIDNIEKIAELGTSYGVPVHVDACLGGFLVPFMDEAGYPIAPFDFRLEGVTSISCDTHKYGYAPKGSSVILYRQSKYLHHQYVSVPEWMGGVYATPTLAGSRCGLSIALTWATLLYYGRDGYVLRTSEIVDFARRIKSMIEKIDGLRLLGSPDVSVVAFTSDVFHIYALVDLMAARGWNINALQNPPGAHYCVTYNTVSSADSWKTFTSDLKDIAAELISDPSKGKNSSTAAFYGMAASVPDTNLISEVAYSYLDACYAMPSRNS